MTSQPPQDEVEEVARAMGAVLIPGPVTIPASRVMSKELMAKMAGAAITMLDRLRGAAPAEGKDSELASLRSAALDCAEYIEGVLSGDDFDGGCDWPDVDGGDWCSQFCRENGCAKSRSYRCRDAIAKAES